MLNLIKDQFEYSEALFRRMAGDDQLARTIGLIVDQCVKALNSGHKLFFMGNGGSAADAQHLAGEMVSRFNYDRPGLPALALTTDTSIITAIGNDYGYDRLFARQIQALGRAGDVVFGISTSGNSPNVLAGLETARDQGLITVGFTGARPSKMDSLAQYLLKIPSELTPKIQEGHICVGHLICGLIEAAIFPRSVDKRL